MADVNKYLADIKEAVYGEEVRSSIHDAIDVINKEVVDYNAVVTEKSEAAAESARSAESAAESAANAQSAAKTASDTAAVKAAEAAESAESALNAKEQIKESADNAAAQAINAKTEADRAKTEADKAASIVDIDVAKLDKAGIVKPDGKTITIDLDGTIHSLGTLNYNDMENKPTINGFEMNGNAELEDIGVYADIQTFINGVFSGFLGRNFSFMENMSPDEYFKEIRSAYPNQTINLFIQKQDDTLFNALPVQNSCILTTRMTDMAGYAQAFDCKTKDIYIFNWYDEDGYPNGGSWQKLNETVDMDSSKALNTFVGKRVAEGCTGEDVKQQNVVMGYAAGNGLENSQTGNTYLGTLAGGNAAGSYNTAVGDCAFSGNYKDATFSKSTGNYNTAAGYLALNKNTEGSYNTAIGNVALRSNTTGYNNTAIGSNALYRNSEGACNTAVGTISLQENTTGIYNTAVGYSALDKNTEGKYNAAVGAKALNSNTTGSYNIAVGDKTLNSNTTGHSNTAIGNCSLYCNETGIKNTAIGSGTLYSNTTGNNNVAVGTDSLYNNTVGVNNIAIGEGSLNSNTEGNDNIAIGKNTLQKSNTTSGNVAIGAYVLNNNTSGFDNVAIAAGALDQNTTGNNNTAVGKNSLNKNTEGSFNTAIGRNTLNTNTKGGYNVAIGNSALQNNISGNTNTAVGNGTLENNTTGHRNTAVGTGALFNLSTYECCTGLGQGAETTGSYQVQLGSSSESVYCYGSVQNRSDARDKVDVKDTDLGLDFIKALRPVKFRWNYREAYRVLDEKGNVVIHENDGSKSGKRFHDGLIAQEVKKVMDEMGVEFAGYQDHKINGGEDVLSIGYTELISPLIKAIQELDNEIRELKDFIAK